MSWIATYTGKSLDLLHPEPDQVHVIDIAVALARMPRFAGHTTEFYSVAQHSVLTAWLCQRSLKLAALLYDASKAYLCDLPRPIKQHLPEYRAAEDRLMRVIAGKYGFAWPVHSDVKQADAVMLETEHRDLMPHSPPWEQRHAEPLPDFTIEPWGMQEACVRLLENLSRYSDLAHEEAGEVEFCSKLTKVG